MSPGVNNITTAMERAAKRAIAAVSGGVRQALAYALHQNALKRVKRPDPYAEALPGYRAGRNSHAARVEIMERLNAAGGPDLARECSWVLCEVGSVPSPAGVPSANSAARVVTPVIAKVLDAVRWMAHRHYRERRYRSLAVPKKSSMGFPYFVSGPDALPLRTLYFKNYADNLDFIRGCLERNDWVELSKGDGCLPMYCVMTVNYRLQPQQAKLVEFDAAGHLTKVHWKEREVMDAAGNYRIMDTSIRDWPEGSTNRARAINQISSSGAMLGQANEDPYRCSYYSTCALFEIPSIPERARNYRSEFIWSDFEFASLDFGAMEKSCDAPVWNASIQGMKDAGCSLAFINLKNALHFGAYLIGEDDYRRKPALPVRIHGDITNPSAENDLGHRSGEPATDTDNKDVGVAVYGTGIFETGGFGPQANYHRTFASFMEEFGDMYVLQGRRVPDAPYGIAANAGDDVLTGGRREYKHRLGEWCATLAPYFDVKIEKDTQFLGHTCNNDGTAYPYIGKFYSNFLSPERSWYSKMRVDNYPLGVFARLEHFSAHPDFLLHQQILFDVCRKWFGETPLEIAERAAVNRAIPRNFNLAEILFLSDPTTLAWGRVKQEDIRPEILEAVDFYLNISPERVEALTL